MGLSNLERESIFLYNDAEKSASVYTYNAALQKQLAALCAAHPDQVRQTADNGRGGLTFELPKKWIRVVPPRVLSPAQREVLDRMNRSKKAENSG